MLQQVKQNVVPLVEINNRRVEWTQELKSKKKMHKHL